MTKSHMVLAALAALAASGCTAPSSGGYGGGIGPVQAATGPSTCFLARDVNNFNTRERQTVYVSTRQGYVFRLDTPPGCFDAATQSVALEPFGSVGARICVGDRVRVAVRRFSSPPMRCIANVSGPIRDSAESGLPSRQD